MILSLTAAAAPWMDATKTPNERVALLLPHLSLEEKVNQLLHVWTTFNDNATLARYGNTSVGAMYIKNLDANQTCDVLPHCRLKARNAFQAQIMAQSAHHIPISFVTESLHSPMTMQAHHHQRRDDHGPSLSPCAKAVHAACPGLSGPACEACAALHASLLHAKCPTPGQIATACGGGADASPMGIIFPMPAGQGSSWNRTLVRAINAAVAAEARANGADRGFSPELQVAVDPRFGRTQENYGGDPFLVSELGEAATLGLHGGERGGPNSYLPNYNTTITSEAKHFAAYGLSAYDGAPADVSITSLYDIYLRPWKRYVESGGRAAMAAHNSVNGIPMHSSQWLLTDVLRVELGGEEMMIGTDYRDIQLLSDMNTANHTRYGAISSAAPDTDASIQALNAGVDQDLSGYSFPSLLGAQRAGLLPAAGQGVHSIDIAAANVLRAKFASGLFEQPLTPLALQATIDSVAHRELARAAVVDGATLLQNIGHVLPRALSSLHRVALVGPNAACAVGDESRPCGAQNAAMGGYTPKATPSQVRTVGDALLTRLPASVALDVVVETGDAGGIARAVNATTHADLAIVVLGDSSGSCGESEDRMSLDLIGNQLDLLDALVATHTPIVVVLVHGRPVTFGGSRASRWGSGGSNALLKGGRGGLAVLSVWRPGETGGDAVLDVVLGMAQPGGRLAQPWPRSVGYVASRAVPYWNLHQGDYDWGNTFPAAGVPDKPWALADGEPWSPLWCFGHGESYSNYSMTPDSLVVTGGPLRSGGGGSFPRPASHVVVTVTVVDLARFKVEGAAVVQIFAAPLSASRTGVVRRKKMLVGFAKVWVPASGEGVAVDVHVRAEELGYTVYNPRETGAKNHPWVVESGEVRLLACFSECDCPLQTTIIVV